MGDSNSESTLDREAMRAFTKALLVDVSALERMLDAGLIESNVRRIGAEQELFLVDRAMHPALTGLKVLEKVDQTHFTPELGLFNLEINLSPQRLRDDCLWRMEQQIEGLLTQARRAAESIGSRILLTGILPTMKQKHLTLESMTPLPRYLGLNRTTLEHRGSEFRLSIKGLDELQTSHDNVMFEACNTSFQIHFQVGPDEFAELYNLAQAVTGPVLAAAVNSPVFLQHRLWAETRVALFQQSIDSRSEAHQARQSRPRVVFGDRWVDKSVLEIYREDVARFRVFMSSEVDEDPMAVLDQGGIPKLACLCQHNGTVYRWNRPCYGVHNGVAHLRIEHRALPAGPTVADEIANAAFFHGLMTSLSARYGDITKVLRFDDAKNNFTTAARYGLHARLTWIDGKTVPADELILNELLPAAREGLESKDIRPVDIDHYLGILEERVRSGRTGSQWALDSLASMGEHGRPDERYRALTACMYLRQMEGKPVHEWEPATLEEGFDWRDSCRTVEQVMSTDLFTLHPEDLVDLAASVMDWEHVRHVPVEDVAGKLVGIVSHRQVLRMVGRGIKDGTAPVAVREIMTPDPLTVDADTLTLTAIEMMREHKVSCLPVTNGEGKLIGIVTEADFIQITARLLEEKLREP